MSTFTKSDILRLAEIVRDETGNDVQEKNFPMLESRIRTHMMKIGITAMSDYWQHFERNEEKERETLQSLMTTHYTFFFREFAHFEILQQWIETEHLRIKERYAATKTPVRIWSAACSRGQEVYSLAMFLEVNLFKKWGIPFEIVGTDIDPESVAFAENGVYPIKEVNSIPGIYLNGFWKRGTGAIKDFAAVHPDLKKRVRFQAFNLLEIENWSEKQTFDVVFCRNVFIYFSPENVRTIALNLTKRLDERGLFISGMSEPLRFADWTLTSIGPSCYQRPLKTPAKTEAKTPTLAVVASPSSPNSEVQKKYRVLCVDDSTTIQLLMKKIFSQDPLCEKVDIAGNGKEARTQLDTHSYDLITLDIHMPEVNGIEFLEKFYNKKSDPPVIMVSSVNRTDIELATKSMSLGAFDYVEKPAMNNLQKSSSEILTKAKMALRADRANDTSTNSFDTSIAQKIVIPDASQAMRFVWAGANSIDRLSQIVKGQQSEYRSPSLLIIWNDSSTTSLEAELLNWSNKQIVSVRDEKQFFRPNTIYVATTDLAEKILTFIKVTSISIQVLESQGLQRLNFDKKTRVQILADEKLTNNKSGIESQLGSKISDITPATSFPSLSVEFFANLRKASA